MIEEELPKLRQVFHKKAIANISGFSVEDYAYTAALFDKEEDIAILEINISCPNVRHGGMAFGTDPEAAASVCRAVKQAVQKPVYMKLSPNVTDIAAIAKAVAEAGADGIVLINTLLGMRIEPRTGKPIVSTKMAGFSGPAIKPVALRMVWQCHNAVGIPILGMGGICTGEDAVEFMLCGATAVAVGTANFMDPLAAAKVVDGIAAYCKEQGVNDVNDLIGALEC